MRSVYAYSPFDDGAYARTSFLEKRQTYLENESLQQEELIEAQAQINVLKEQLDKKRKKS